MVTVTPPTASLEPNLGLGLNRLPIEIRFQIYKLAWEPRTVYIGIGRRKTKKPPVTFHLNHEARLETLRHYQEILWGYIDDNGRQLTRCDYINPSLDILHLDHTWLGYSKPLLQGMFRRSLSPMPGYIREPVLRVTLDPAMPPTFALSMMRRLFPDCPAFIRTIDFRIRSIYKPASRASMRGRVPVKRTIEATSRYRICRPARTKTTVARWEQAAFVPKHFHDDLWGWEYYPEASRPLNILPPNLNTSVDTTSEASWPIPGTGRVFYIPCIVSKLPEINSRDILQQDRVLMFDAGFLDPAQAAPSKAAKTPNTPPPGHPPLAICPTSADPVSRCRCKQDKWSILKVVSPERITDHEMTALAFGHLFTHSVLHMRDLPGQDFLEIFPNNASHLRGALGLRNLVVRLEELERTWSRLARRGYHRMMGVAEMIHGVCSPDYMYEGGGGSGKDEDDEDWKYGTPDDLFENDETRESRTPLESGTGIVDIDKVFCMDPTHAKALKRTYSEKDGALQEGLL